MNLFESFRFLQPQWLWLLPLALLLPPIPITRASFDYLFVFDITQSMNVTDAGPGSAGISRARIQSS